MRPEQGSRAGVGSKQHPLLSEEPLSTFSLWCVPGGQTQVVFAECSKPTLRLNKIYL